jgi:predicted nucleic acid-binding protein
MRVVIDSTVIFHLNYQKSAMTTILIKMGITSFEITRINYLELLAGTSENSKIYMRRFLKEFRVLEFDKKAVDIANNLSMKYRVDKRDSKDFLIACIAIANKLPLLTENNKDFNYTELTLLPYRI